MEPRIVRIGFVIETVSAEEDESEARSEERGVGVMIEDLDVVIHVVEDVCKSDARSLDS